MRKLSVTCLLATKCDASTEFKQKLNRKRKTFHDEVSAGKPGESIGAVERANPQSNEL